MVNKTEKVTNTLVDKTTTIVGTAAGATKDTAASVVDNSAKLAKSTADKSSEVANKAWDGTKNAAAAGLEGIARMKPSAAIQISNFFGDFLSLMFMH